MHELSKRIKEEIEANGVDVNGCFQENTFIEILLKFGSLKLIDEIIEAGAKLTPKQQEAVSYIRNANEELFKEAKKEGQNLEVLLERALAAKNVEMADYIIKKSHKIKQENRIKYNNAFKYEIHLSQIIRNSINSGLSPNGSFLGNIFLFLAIEKESLELVEYLIEKGASTSISKDSTALHYAVTNSNLEIVDAVFKKEDMDRLDRDKRTAIQLSIINDKYDIFKYLTFKGASFDVWSENEDIASLAAQNEDPRFLKDILYHKNNYDLKAAFLSACKNACIDVMQLLFNNGLGFEKEHDELLKDAVKYGNPKSLLFLLYKKLQIDDKLAHELIDESCDACRLDNYKVLKDFGISVYNERTRNCDFVIQSIKDGSFVF